MDYYSRKCDACNTGMEEGYLIEESEYGCSEKCSRELLTDEVYENGMRQWREEGDCVWLFWTDWEQDWELEETLFLKDGTEVANPFFNLKKFSKLYRRAS